MFRNRGLLGHASSLYLRTEKKVICCSSGCCWRPAGVQELEPGMELHAFLAKTLGVCPWPGPDWWKLCNYLFFKLPPCLYLLGATANPFPFVGFGW